jgi:hypothetical protein
MTRRIRPSHAVLTLMTLFLVQGSMGCSEDDSPTVILDNGGAATEYPLPLVSDADAGRDQLVANLALGYERLHYGEYEKLIHASYVFRVDPSEVNIVGQSELSAAEDLESTFRMFSGETGLEPVLDNSGNPTGDYWMVPAVQSIRLDLTPDSASSWTLMTDGEFSGAWRRVYALNMTVNYSGDTRIDQITGTQVLYLAASVVTIDGLVEEVWKIRAWEDQGLFRAPPHGPGLATRAANDTQGSLPLPTDNTSLGQLKSLF